MKNTLRNMIDRFSRRPGSGNNTGQKAAECNCALSSGRNSESGVVLLMVLILSAVALAIMAALLYLVLVGTQTSGMQKRYRTALEAGVAGSDVLTQVISMKGDLSSFNALSATPSAVLSACTGTSLYTGQSYSGLAAKIMTSTTATGGWSAGCVTSLKTDSSNYDMKFSLGTNPTYNVYAKIVDSVEGNTGSGSSNAGGNILITTGVVSNNGGEVQVRAVPFLYTMEMDVENANSSSNERAKLQVLYQY